MLCREKNIIYKGLQEKSVILHQSEGHLIAIICKSKSWQVYGTPREGTTKLQLATRNTKAVSSTAWKCWFGFSGFFDFVWFVLFCFVLFYCSCETLLNSWLRVILYQQESYCINESQINVQNRGSI